MFHRDDTTYKVLPCGDVIEARCPLYGEPIEDPRGWWHKPTQKVIGSEAEHLTFRLGPDGALAINSTSADLPGWHHVATLAPGSTAEDVLKWVKGREFAGRQFWQPAV